MPPLAIAAGIGAAASIGGAVLSAKSNKKAANTAAAAQTANTNANNALTRENRDFLAARLDPTVQSGLRSSNLIDSFLFGNQPQPPQASVQPASTNPLMGYPGGFNTQPNISGDGGYTYPGEMGPYNVGDQGMVQPQGGVTAPGPGGSGLSGWDQFVASPYYQAPLREGYNSLGTGWASQGAYRSGAATKGAIRFGQDYGAGRMDEFLGLAERQAGRGLAGASALGGVTQNALAMTTQNNNNAADATSNAALLRGQASNSLYGSIGGALGTFASSFAPNPLYGYGK